MFLLFIFLIEINSLSSCIFALITTSVDISVLVLSALTLLSLTKSFQCVDHTTGMSTECRLCGEENPLTGVPYDCSGGKEAFHHSLEGFSSSVVWLIFAAFHLGKAVEVTKLGKRISLIMIRSFGKRVIGLAYAILFSGTNQKTIKIIFFFTQGILFFFRNLISSFCTK
ncbi:MAG: anion permease [Paenibacillus sp.]|nr:anion permease [Paenibacillus sp.]